MTEPISSADPQADASEPLTGPPRWVKVLIAIAVALAVVFLVLKLTGKGAEHGPGRHGRAFDSSHLTLEGSRAPW